MVELELDVIDISPYLLMPRVPDPNLAQLCITVSQNLKEFGVLLVKDPRCDASDLDRFIDMMEAYFKTLSRKPYLCNQGGLTPEKSETLTSYFLEEHRPATRVGPDPKCRYFWKVGPRPETTEYKELCSDPIIPEDFPDWKETMDTWGNKMLATVQAVAEMAAFGCGLEYESFTNEMNLGPHVLVSTGTDLEKYGEEGTVIEAYHYDLNLLTIHSRNRFPGMNVWLINKEKVEVNVPEGCFLIQPGKQMEWFTSGVIKACKHEVVVTDKTIDAINEAKEHGQSLWRVTSTLYAHVASDRFMKPLENYEIVTRYIPVTAGDYVEEFADTSPDPI